MAKSHIIAGLDIGTNFIRVVVASPGLPSMSQTSNQLEILGVGVSRSNGLRKGVIINIEATVASIAKAIAEAESLSGHKIKSLSVSLSGSHIEGFNSHGIVGVKGSEVNVNDLEKVIDAAKAVAIPVDRELLHIIPQEYIVDGQDGIHEPLGISGVRLESRVHLITGSVSASRNLVKCISRCGITTERLMFSPLASAKSILTNEEKELGVCLIDIGAGTSDVVIYAKGQVAHSFVLPIAGNHITNDIAAGLRTPLKSAEELKVTVGEALRSREQESQYLSVPSTAGREERTLSQNALADIVEARMREIFGLIKSELVQNGFDYEFSSGVVLCGGTAGLQKAGILAEQVFSVPVRIGYPSECAGLHKLVARPDFSCVAGLVESSLEIANGSDKSFVFKQSRKTAFRGALKNVSGWISKHF